MSRLNNLRIKLGQWYQERMDNDAVSDPRSSCQSSETTVATTTAAVASTGVNRTVITRLIYLERIPLMIVWQNILLLFKTKTISIFHTCQA